MSLQDTVKLIEEDLDEVLVERSVEIHCSMLALLAKKHLFLYGEPGTAKSLLVDEVTRRITPATNFKYLLTKFSVPEEIFGALDLLSLQQSVYRRITKGKLPTADIGFLDEAFKASSAILNSLLKMLNEREFDNPGDDPHIPLITLFAASNEIPTSTELEALADRLHFWIRVSRVRDPSNILKMLTATEREPKHTMSLDQLKQAQAEVEKIVIDDSVYDAMIALADKLRGNEIMVTDRKLRQAMDVVKAEAWYQGSDKALMNHIHPLQHMFWRDPSQIDKVREAVLDLADPIERRVLDLQEDWDKAYTSYVEDLKESDLAEGTRRTMTYELFNKYKECKKDLQRLQREVSNSGQPQHKAIAKFSDRLRKYGPELISQGFGLELDQIDALSSKFNVSEEDE